MGPALTKLALTIEGICQVSLQLEGSVHGVRKEKVEQHSGQQHGPRGGRRERLVVLLLALLLVSGSIMGSGVGDKHTCNPDYFLMSCDYLGVCFSAHRSSLFHSFLSL